mmetsp:Transcript_77547/g.122266  ORF Transcript_77547/g.122266 Transcript_77547/m.122266 type:complete len:85 (+) Transcript_77547:88-342(+)
MAYTSSGFTLVLQVPKKKKHVYVNAIIDIIHGKDLTTSNASTAGLPHTAPPAEISERPPAQPPDLDCHLWTLVSFGGAANRAAP